MHLRYLTLFVNNSLQNVNVDFISWSPQESKLLVNLGPTEPPPSDSVGGSLVTQTTRGGWHYSAIDNNYEITPKILIYHIFYLQNYKILFLLFYNPIHMTMIYWFVHLLISGFVFQYQLRSYQNGYVCMMGGLCSFRGRGCRSAAMVAPLASSGPVRCETVIHGYQAMGKPVGGGNCTNLWQCVLMMTL